MSNMTFGTAVAVVLVAASLSSASAGPLLSQNVIGDPGASGSGEIHHSWNGRTYCWSESGWKGAGWYRCGFAARRGLGWGGPAGWHGWTQETSSDIPIKRRGSGTAFRSTPSVAPLSGSRSSGGILNSPLTNPSATSSGSLSGSGGAASSGSASSLGATAPSTSGSGGSSSSLGSSTSSISGSGSSSSSSSSSGTVGGGR